MNGWFKSAGGAFFAVSMALVSMGFSHDLSAFAASTDTVPSPTPQTTAPKPEDWAEVGDIWSVHKPSMKREGDEITFMAGDWEAMEVMVLTAQCKTDQIRTRLVQDSKTEELVAPASDAWRTPASEEKSLVNYVCRVAPPPAS